MTSTTAQSGQAVTLAASATRRPWWETRRFVAALILLSIVPLLYPPIPPLVDLFGHIGRYRVQLDLDSSPWLSNYYGFRWAAIGNLGVDVLVLPLAPLFGLENAVKLIVLAIPAMTVAGFLWVAREVHHRLPPTALFALPFVYSHPFMFGFVNFALSVALAFLAFGLWLRLARIGRLKLRAILFVPISLVVFFAHTFGWGMLGLLCFSAEAVRQHDEGRGWFCSGVNAALHASVMTAPIAIMFMWKSDAPSETTDWFNWKVKWRWVYAALRDRWRWYDIGSLAVCGLVFLYALVSRKLTLSRNLAFTGLVLAACFVILPRIIFGSAYADMRLVPYVFAVALLAIRFRGETQRRTAQVLAVLGLTFFIVRTAGTTASMAIAARDQQAKLAAVDHIPAGARVASLYGVQCGNWWPLWRNAHLGAMVIARKHGFSNEQWQMEGLNLLEIRYRAPGAFAYDPSEVVRPNGCPNGLHLMIDQALRALPRQHFDYLWLIDPPPHDRSLLAGMERVWAGAGSELYRINPDGEVRPPETLRTASAPGR